MVDKYLRKGLIVNELWENKRSVPSQHGEVVGQGAHAQQRMQKRLMHSVKTLGGY